MIKTICKPMRCGKTFDAIKLCSETPQSVIVCFSRQEAKRVFDLAKSNEIKIPFPVTIDEVLGKHLEGSNYIRLIIDNLDIMLPQIFKRTVTAITMLGEERHPWRSGQLSCRGRHAQHSQYRKGVTMSEVTNFCRLSTTPDKSCVCVDKNWCKACNTGFDGTFYQSFEVCPCPSQMQPVIRKSRMDELIDECLMDMNNSWRASVRKIFAPAVDALERFELAKKNGLAVIARHGTKDICNSADVSNRLADGFSLVGWVVEYK